MTDELCKHRRRLFISRETRTSTNADPYRASAFVCPECGEFHVWINGVDMTFTLVTDEQVTAAAQYIKRLAVTDAPSDVNSPPWLQKLYRQADASAEDVSND